MSSPFLPSLTHLHLSKGRVQGTLSPLEKNLQLPPERLPSMCRAGKCGQGEQELSHLGEAMGTEGAPPALTAQAVGT